MELLSSEFTEGDTESLFDFLILQALGDTNPDVRRGMLAAGLACIDVHGAALVDKLMTRFESHLATKDTSTETSDHVKEAVIVLFGRLAGHLDSGDPRLPTIINRLVLALEIPSETVQVAIASCLAPLVETIDDAQELIQRLITQAISAPRYAGRRGAAYGLAGAIGGLGVSSMKTYNVLRQLK